jgi:hypothetical protein
MLLLLQNPVVTGRGLLGGAGLTISTQPISWMHAERILLAALENIIESVDVQEMHDC